MAAKDVKFDTNARDKMLTGVNTWYRAGGRLEQDAIERMYCEMALGVVGARP